MALEINRSYNQYKTDYAEYLKSEQSFDKIERVKETEKGQSDVKVSDDTPAEYISSEKADVKPSGLYSLGYDENGNPKVFFDKQKKSEEKCTANTDKVDREIEKLKEKKKHLEQQIKSASGDEKKVNELEKKLKQVENELNKKDNDTYRRQNTSFSE